MNNLTIKDLPIINRYGLKRWDIITDQVKSNIGEVIREVISTGDAKEKLVASSLALRIDCLNLKHEQTYIPKVNFELSRMSDEELKQAINDLSNAINTDSVLDDTTHSKLSN